MYQVSYDEIKTPEKIKELYDEYLLNKLRIAQRKSGMTTEQYCKVLVNTIFDQLRELTA